MNSLGFINDHTHVIVGNRDKFSANGMNKVGCCGENNVSNFKFRKYDVAVFVF